MKTLLKNLSFLVIALGLLNTSCRKEEFDFQGTPPEQRLNPESNVANLLIRTSLNDGSIDNIIDGASCFSVMLPVTVIANGNELTLETEADYDLVEFIFEESEDDTDTLELVFPVTIIFPDYSEIVVSNAAEFDSFVDDCEEGSEDDDIECVDFVFPITISKFNQNTEQFSKQAIGNDKALFNVINNLEDNDVVQIEFPVSLIIHDNENIEAFSLEELESIITENHDDCDEDDDNDFDDDDCEDCSIDILLQVFESCPEWTVDVLNIGGTPLQDLYEIYSFNFQMDGALIVTTDTSTFFGSWQAMGSSNVIQLDINIPELEDFNGIWDVNEIALGNSLGKVNLIMGEDRLRFDNACTSGNQNGNTPQTIGEVLEDGLWNISSYDEGGVDLTLVFNGFDLNFDSDGSVVADNGVPINGTWGTEFANTRLIIDFGTATPFDTLNKSWTISSLSETQVEVRFLTTGSGPPRTDVLTLAKQ